MTNSPSIFGLFLLITFTLSVDSKRIANQKIYETLQSQHFCFRRLNATHSIGCQSETSGNVGIIHIVRNQTDLDWILKTGTTPPFIPVLFIEHFTKDVLTQFRSTDRVVGVFLVSVNSTTTDVGFSSDRSCPNDNYGLYTDTMNANFSHCSVTKWNAKKPSLGMMFEDWKFPIFMINDEKSFDSINTCFEKYSKPINGVARDWPLCAAQLQARMKAAKDTPTCMRRSNLQLFSLNPQTKFCDPISNYNVFNPLFPMTNKIIENGSVIVVATRMDSFSMFNDVSPGADSVITSIVALLSIAKTINAHRDELENDTNVLFSVFDGEAWDYIGSSRVAFDLKNGNFKPTSNFNKFQYSNGTQMRLESISQIIELNQLAVYDKSDPVYIHIDPVSQRDSKIKNATEGLLKTILNAAEGQNLKIKRTRSDILPPSSLQSFLSEDISISGLVISNFETEFKNKYYNSFLDDGNHLNVQHQVERIKKISAIVSTTLYESITKKNLLSPIVVDTTYISTLLNCFLTNTSCEEFATLGIRMPKDFLMRTYASVMSPLGLKAITSTIERLFDNITGTVVSAEDSSSCLKLSKEDPTFFYDWIISGNNDCKQGCYCVKNFGFLTEARSPAFLNDDPELWKSTKWSTWTESIWDQTEARIFLKPSSTQEWLTFGIGILVFCFSYGIVFWFSRHSSTIFGSPASSTIGVSEGGVTC